VCDDGQVNTRDRIWRELVFFGGKSGTLEFDALFWREEWNIRIRRTFLAGRVIMEPGLGWKGCGGS
jgi:hypothetical protein